MMHIQAHSAWQFVLTAAWQTTETASPCCDAAELHCKFNVPQYLCVAVCCIPVEPNVYTMACIARMCCQNNEGLLMVCSAGTVRKDQASMQGRPDDRNNPLHLFFCGQPSGPRAGRLTPDINDICPLLDHHAGVLNSPLDPLDLTPITEAVRGDVKDAHDPGPLLPCPVWQVGEGDEGLQVRGWHALAACACH